MYVSTLASTRFDGPGVSTGILQQGQVGAFSNHLPTQRRWKLCPQERVWYRFLVRVLLPLTGKAPKQMAQGC